MKKIICNAEGGMLNAVWKKIIPNSAFRIPHLIIAVVIFFLMGISFFSQAQVIVRVKPVPPVAVVVRPVSPGPGHVWIDGFWRWNPKVRQYVWVHGYWTRGRRGMAWVPGHWIDAPGGFKWIPGHWRRR